MLMVIMFEVLALLISFLKRKCCCFLDGILKTPTPSASGTTDQLPSQECLISHLSVSSQSSCESCHAASASNTPQSPPVVVSASNTPQTSPVTEFLVYPTPIRKTRLKSSNKCARVLTSAESRRLLREKEQKKKDEEEEKARREREREEKRVTREEEKKRKLAEREAKKEAIAKKKAEKQKKQKKQKKTKGNNNPVAFVVPSSSVNRKLGRHILKERECWRPIGSLMKMFVLYVLGCTKMIFNL